MPIPSVTIYIRSKSPKRHYELVKTRKPQECGEGDVYCLHTWHNGKRNWKVVGTNFGEALNQQFATVNALTREDWVATPKPEAKPTLAVLKQRFVEYKRTTGQEGRDSAGQGNDRCVRATGDGVPRQLPARVCAGCRRPRPPAIYGGSARTRFVASVGLQQLHEHRDVP